MTAAMNPTLFQSCNLLRWKFYESEESACKVPLCSLLSTSTNWIAKFLIKQQAKRRFNARFPGYGEGGSRKNVFKKFVIQIPLFIIILPLDSRIMDFCASSRRAPWRKRKQKKLADSQKNFSNKSFPPSFAAFEFRFPRNVLFLKKLIQEI